MKNKVQVIAFLLIIIILMNIVSLCTYNVEAVTQSTSSDLSTLDNSKYPKIKEMIENLKNEHPNWNFKILYTGIDWEEVIANEYTGHGKSPSNLIAKSDSYKGDWICSICGDRVYDSGSWRCASKSAIKYMMDPRASLNSSDVFQFLELSYGDESNYSRDALKQMVKGTFLDNDSYVDTIMNSCKNYNTNPYYIIVRMIQEQGQNGSTLCKGQGYNGQYEGYYNVFNIGATGSGKDNVILNGLKKAQDYGWTSMELSINGGIEIVSKQYIGRGQNTIYLQKFDVDNSDDTMYSHQYMQNVMAAQSEGNTLRKKIGDTEKTFTFIIPVYENMPVEISPRPSTEVPQVEGEQVRVNTTTTLKLRKEPRKDAEEIGKMYDGEIVVRLEMATEKIDGTYWDKIQRSNGVVGYSARCTFDYEDTYKEYLVHVSGEPHYSSNTQAPAEPKKADLDKDGVIDSTDLLYVKKYLLGQINFDDTQKMAADINKDGEIDSTDLLYVKKYLLGQIEL